MSLRNQSGFCVQQKNENQKKRVNDNKKNIFVLTVSLRRVKYMFFGGLQLQIMSQKFTYGQGLN